MSSARSEEVPCDAPAAGAADPPPSPGALEGVPPAALGAHPAESTRRERELSDLMCRARAGDRLALIKFLRARRAG